MKKHLFLVFIILIIILLNFHKLLEKDNIKYMNIFELIQYNLKLYLINNSGITYLKENGSNMLDTLTNDELMIKFHRNLNNKYGKIVKSHIITYSDYYYILDTELSKKILNDSPFLFGPGILKKEFFNTFMPNNLGISYCNNKLECPWKKRRKFNEDVLGTKNITNFYKCIPDIIKKT